MNFLKQLFTSKQPDSVITEEAVLQEQFPANVEGSEEFNEANSDSITEDLQPNLESTFDPEYLLHSPQIAGWLSTEEQELLFQALLLFYSNDQSILDVGCGRADLFGYLNNTVGVTEYKGIDYNPNVLEVAKNKYTGVDVTHADILQFQSEKTYDWVVGSGLFNLNDFPDMTEYAKNCIDKMYELSNYGVAFNLLTGFPEDLADSDREQLVAHDPGIWLNYLIEKYTKVLCRTDYMSGDVTFFIIK